MIISCAISYNSVVVGEGLELTLMSVYIYQSYSIITVIVGQHTYEGLTLSRKVPNGMDLY